MADAYSKTSSTTEPSAKGREQENENFGMECMDSGNEGTTRSLLFTQTQKKKNPNLQCYGEYCAHTSPSLCAEGMRRLIPFNKCSLRHSLTGIKDIFINFLYI